MPRRSLQPRPARRTVRACVLAAALAAGCASSPPALAPRQQPSQVGPQHGFLVVAGGGQLDSAVYRRFIELAGGPMAPIVVIPTAGGEDSFPPSWRGMEELRVAGARNLRVVHTRDRRRADAEEFAATIRNARGVWILGGRPWRLAEAYLGTRAHAALRDVLDRGGVVGGTSAGASILASFLVRGAPESNQIVVAPAYTTGFGLLRGVAVDQHLRERNRQDDLLGVLRTRPDLLGIGIDEGTAIVVQGDLFEVAGIGGVAVYSVEEDAGAPAPVRRYLAAGQRYDMRVRRILDAGS